MDSTDSTENAAASFSGIPLADAPVLLLVYFHKAVRAELAELRRVAFTALEHDHELILELHRRFEFLKLVYKYHCANEDEVIFSALDVHIQNVASAYSLQHKSIDELFVYVFHHFDVLLDGNEEMSKPFEQLFFCIATIQSVICQHMLKEEEQVFPLLMQLFSSKEQASLLCQFLCSVPVLLLEAFLPWMISFLPQDEKIDVTRCIKEVLPEETSLQEAVTSWLGNNSQSSLLAHTKTGKRVQHPDRSQKMNSLPKLLSSKRSSEEKWFWKKEYGVQKVVGHNLLDDGLPLLHRAIKEDLEGILNNLYQIRNSTVFSDLDSVVFQLKFLIDVLIIYSAALEKFYYPVLNERRSGCLSPPREQFHFESLQQLLHHYFQNGIPLRKFVEKLLGELGSFVMHISEQFSFQETEVFTAFSQNCRMQQQLLYMTLYMMPLGLLKCVVTWFSAHLSEDESRSILCGINQGDSSDNKSFALLLREWFRIGYSGKISVENFRMNLQQMFKSRCSFLSDQIREAVEDSSLHPNMQPCKGTKQRQMEPNCTNKDNKCFSNSPSPDTLAAKKNETSDSGEISLHKFFPQTIMTLHAFPKSSVQKSCTSSILHKPIPMDLIFFFHKALKKNLDYLVFGSAELAEDALFLVDFHRRFHLVQFLFQIHSDAEDKIAFPALEAKGNHQNISHSYSIDHRLEGEHFRKISHILNKMFELQVSVSNIGSITKDQKYRKLCIRLHDTCRSMHKLLSEHVQLWPLFRECFSIKEQEKIVNFMLGRIRAETLQDMIPWLMAALTLEERHTMMSLWRSATKYTMFEEWLGEWWEGYHIAKVPEESSVVPSLTADPLEIISTYMSKEAVDERKGESLSNGASNFLQTTWTGTNIEALKKCNVGYKAEIFKEERNNNECSVCREHGSEGEKKRCNDVAGVTGWVDKPGQFVTDSQKLRDHQSLLAISQGNLEAAIRRLSRDSSLDSQKKSCIIQHLLMSRWITRVQVTHPEVTTSSNGKEIPGQHPSYRDPLKLSFGCKHYKRKCKLVASCCNQLYTCIRCHDEDADHSMTRKSVTKMMCMKCLVIQPIGSTCSTISCKNLSMARYYCRICKLFDDDREIYHCPYCNLCRVGKGLGIDYFHCMTCNACMSRSLSGHICRVKSFMCHCPICREDIFTSSHPVKALPCGHLMHWSCFQDYTCTHYTCPICSKSLGDMQVYFRLLDNLLAEEKIPEECLGRAQVILCNDCEKRGLAPFHRLYHKCSCCGSYNTRLLGLPSKI